MLVITRRINQSIIIDGCIEVVVTGITKEGVRIGISAPQEMEIHRSEVFDTIAEANRQATVKSTMDAATALLLAKLSKTKRPK
ncbi:MAG: carbon storage regulator CsrA [Holophagaceae bacterium]|nr:carbon storage regulator CsrA [Holophagaceae bacterium]